LRRTRSSRIHQVARRSDSMRHSIQEINQLDRAEFLRLLGDVFDGAPWIAQKVVGKRPFRDREHVLRLMCDALRRAGPEKQLEVIRAHPDFIGDAARAGVVSAAASKAQSDSGKVPLTPEDVRWFERYNRAYREKYGFPFIFCTRAFKPPAVRRAILDEFEIRMCNELEREIPVAIGELGMIAEFRLRDRIA
jgi:2-oxo-4-hydroxy-4-carboxy-5-ureidoimidazoline decarboxylase